MVIAFLVAVIAISGSSITDQAPLPFMLIWLGIPLYMLVVMLNSLTPKGEFTLVFETVDPFADDDAGDCGSGDGGGCGD